MCMGWIFRVHAANSIQISHKCKYVNGVRAHVQTSAANLKHTPKLLTVRRHICQITFFFSFFLIKAVPASHRSGTAKSFLAPERCSASAKPPRLQTNERQIWITAKAKNNVWARLELQPGSLPLGDEVNRNQSGGGGVSVA